MDILQVSGNKIVNSAGESVFLRGTCVGGWMNMEDFINGYPGTESALKRRMGEVLGQSRAEQFFEKLIDNFLQEDDIAFIAETGANCLRIPLNYRHFEDDDEPFVWKEEGFKRLEKIVSLCEKYKVYVILDMHAVQGWQNCHWHSDNERGASLFWTHRQFQERLSALWVEMAKRYRGRTVIAGYELMNEPASGTPNGDHAFDFFENYRSDWDRINRIYRNLIKDIRAVDSEHIIFLEGDRYGRFFKGFSPPPAENLVYSSHNYTLPGFGPGAYPGYYGKSGAAVYWDRNKHYREFRNHEAVEFADKYVVPLLVGEFGSQYHGPEEEMEDRLHSMEDQLAIYNEYGVHWTTWTFKDAGIMGWVTLDPESEYKQIIQPVQEMKRALGAENFVAHFTPCQGREAAKDLADLIADVSGEPYNKRSNAFGLNYAALTGYAAASLQPAYVRRFADFSKEDIKRVMQAFSFKNCIINERYITLLKRYLPGT